MSKRGIGVWVIVAMVLVAAVWGCSHDNHAGGAIAAKSLTLPSPSNVPPAMVAEREPSKAIGALWDRPPPEVAARRYRRAGFAWIFRQLGAEESLLDRMVDGELAVVIQELEARAEADDPKAINLLGEFAAQQCILGRKEARLTEFEASQVAEARRLPPADGQWVDAALHAAITFDKQVAAVCEQSVDVDHVLAMVETQAKQGDGASLWLLSRTVRQLVTPHAQWLQRQQWLRDAAAAGFPQAQFELAWAIVGGQEGAAGSGASTVTAGELLRESAGVLSQSKATLAICEYRGCSGVTPDLPSAVTHAREAAQRGRVEAMVDIGAHLAASQVDPDEVSAWKLIGASLAQQGCAGNGFSVRDMKAAAETLGSSSVSARARTRAEQYWQRYGAQIQGYLGCG